MDDSEQREMKRHKSNSKANHLIVYFAVVLLLTSSLLIPLAGITDAQSKSSSLSSEKMIHGVSIPVSDKVERQFLNDARGMLAERPSHAFFVATEDSIYVVISDKEPKAGLASVKGTVVGTTLRPDGTGTLKVVSAQSVRFDTTGKQVPLEDLENNSKKYHLDLVETSGFHQQITVRHDPDRGSNHTRPLTVGKLLKQSKNLSAVPIGLISDARGMSIELSKDEVEASSKGHEIASNILYLSEPRIRTVSTQQSFWTGGNRTVTGILIASNSPAWRALLMSDPTGVSRHYTNTTLYVIDSQPEDRQRASIQSITHNPNHYKGTEVRSNAKFIGAKISVQEYLEHNMPACGPDRAEVPTPSGPTCMNLVMDTVIYFGIAWNSAPESRHEVLPVIGVNNEHMDSPWKSVQGEYRIIGRVAETSDISFRLPSGPALIAYDMKKTDTIGSIDSPIVTNEYERLNTTILAQLRNKTVPKSVGEVSNTETQQQTDPQDSETESSQQNNEKPTTQQEEGKSFAEKHPQLAEYIFVGVVWIGIPVALAYSFVEFSGWLWIRLVKFAVWLRTRIL